MISLLLLLLCVQILFASEENCRDRFLEPFSSDSIWNTAIGSDAIFHHVHLFDPNYKTCGGVPYPCKNATSFHNDQDFILLATKDTPLTDWVNQGDWGGDDHCKVTGKIVAQIPVPKDWTSASDGGRSKPGQPNNNAMGILLPDNRTIVQMQPVYRCASGAPLLARWGNTTDGCPQQFPNITDVFGDGALGAHGGSGLSGIGGTIRLGELNPKNGPIKHALKLELQHQWYYGLKPLQPASKYNGGRSQYVWPATGSDGGTQKAPGGLYGGNDPHLAPGALLAIPVEISNSVQVKTIPGAQIKQALIDYGGYIVDDTGAGNSVAICMDAQVNAEMRELFGYAMTYPHGVTPKAGDAGKELYSDLLAIFKALHAVTNNSGNSVGGGGTPRIPTKPPICV